MNPVHPSCGRDTLIAAPLAFNKAILAKPPPQKPAQPTADKDGGYIGEGGGYIGEGLGAGGGVEVELLALWRAALLAIGACG